MKHTITTLIAIAVIAICSCCTTRAAAQTWKWGIGSKAPHSLIEGWPVATDATGNVYAAGVLPNWLDSMRTYFGPDSLHGGMSVLVSADSNGTYRWAMNPGKAVILGVFTDNAGNIYAYGDLKGPAAFGTYTIAPTSSFATFCAKLTGAGTPVWVKKFDNIFFNSPLAAGGIDPWGNVYLACELGFPYNIELIKMDPSGNTIWMHAIGGGGDETPVGLATGPNGDVYVCGSYTSATLTIGPDVLHCPPGLSYPYFFAAKYDSSGAPMWGRSIVSRSLWGQLYGIYTDQWDHVYVSGNYGVNMIFGSDSFATTTGGGNMVLAQYSNTGSLNWLRSVGSGVGYTVAPDGCGNIWTAVGGFLGDSVHIHNFDTLGNVTATINAGPGGDDQSGIAIDNRGNLYLVGDYMVDNVTIGNDTLKLTDSTSEALFIGRYKYVLCTALETLHTGEAGHETISIYPNPASDELTITSTGTLAKATLYDAAGRLLQTYALWGSETTVPLTAIGAGFYIIRVYDQAGVLQKTEKLAKTAR